jgi:hypothetical protein
MFPLEHLQSLGALYASGEPQFAIGIQQADAPDLLEIETHRIVA